MAVATTFEGAYSLTWVAQTKYDDSARANKVTDRVEVGKSKLPVIAASLADGTTANAAKFHYSATLTIAPAGTTTLTLDNASLTSGNGTALAFAKVRRVLIRIRTPASTKTLRVGGTFAMGRAGSGTLFEDVTDVLLKIFDLAGLTVPAGGTITLNNTGSVSLDLDISIVGN